METAASPAAHPLLPSDYSSGDVERLKSSVRCLLKRGSIFRERAGQQEIYDWARLNQATVEAVANLLELRLAWDHEARLIQAIPENTALLRHLRQDETLVLLALWYDYDTALRDHGVDPFGFEPTVSTLLASLEAKFAGLAPPSRSRLREILRLAERYQLVEFKEEDPIETATVRVLPTLRHILPFPSIDEWHRLHRRHVDALNQSTNSPNTDDSED